MTFARTMPPAKAVKTERTHEENQERAYIAASRRSDRSLEARIESARRASDIHKRRTGRALKVTEQDVLNEEMYEEEDDDMPAHYRRLTAHLQTGSADFNRKLAAYLCTNVAMRSAVEQAINYSYTPEAAALAPVSMGGQPFAPNPMFQTPMPMLPLQHQQQRAQMMMMQQQQQQQQMQSPTSYRQSPYPLPQRPLLQQQQQQMMQQQMAQMAQMTQGAQQDSKQEIKKEGEPDQEQDAKRPTPLAIRTHSGLNIHDRRQSVPITSSGAMSPVDTHAPMSATITPKQRPSFPPGTFSQANMSQASMSQQTHVQMQNSSSHSNFGPFGMPADAQMFSNSTVNAMCNDPLLNNWSGVMAGSSSMSGIGNPYGNIYALGAQLSDTNGAIKHQIQPTFDGLNTTLAPPADTNTFNDSIQPFNTDESNQATEFDGVTMGGNEDGDSFFDYENWNAPTASQ
ncbi:hypothetical protein HYFRA_00005781 [Hymenoscyphus fraxineus]|uniref:Uncharacterized protein n=1 Tax=Hymenoscyphus fraxineus TaxID=746836 RepID=A0A9N9KZ75_9HELO|nr:hypothetical protein HYFRA_00005781 [Hymenoscyphus fraxineus]